MSEKLLPCPNPWCSELYTRTIRSLSVGAMEPVRWVRCGCGMCGPTRKTRSGAIVAWNTRAVSPREVALANALEAIVDQILRSGTRTTRISSSSLENARATLAEKDGDRNG